MIDLTKITPGTKIITNTGSDCIFTVGRVIKRNKKTVLELQPENGSKFNLQEQDFNKFDIIENASK